MTAVRGNMHILMVAAENDALEGGKVGGLGDVVRDLPLALAELGHTVSVISPGYGVLAASERASAVTQFATPFAGGTETIELFRVASAKESHPNVTHFVLEHWLFSAGGVGAIYCADHYGPFATDAHKFALFCSAVCEAMVQKILPAVDVIHCHDWHSANVLILREYAEAYRSLKSARTVYSIHNLSIQGIRPLHGDDSSLDGWFPGLQYDVRQVGDHFSRDCVNFMRAGIRLADKVNTVSPTYAEEILKPSHWEEAVVGGEGLESDLLQAKAEGRLYGILNGCDYRHPLPQTDSKGLYQLMDECLEKWALPAIKHSHIHSASYYFALRAINRLRKKRSANTPVLLSIGRMSYQKLGMLIAPYDEHTVLEELLSRLKPGLFIMVGTGEAQYDHLFSRCMARFDNFLFLNGYSETLVNHLYNYANMFLMPSIYEPCGISQMLAMRGGMPCIAHATGGLKDTVIDGRNGFTFSGDDMASKSTAFINTTLHAVDLFCSDTDAWETLKSGALHSRFEWKTAAKDYERLLYVGTKS
ncbi:MAG: glycogen/starch synthase [Oleibacter sp.]|nr:glycogen/starch synthase [Thalassolituus sp.]